MKESSPWMSQALNYCIGLTKKQQRTIETKIVWLEITVYDTAQEDRKGARVMRIHKVTQ